MKKFGMMLVVVLMAFSMFVSSASAAAGWQVLGYDYVSFYRADFNENSDTTFIRVSEDGGNVGITVPDHPVSYLQGTAPVLEIRLYEDDGTYGDDHIGTLYYNAYKEGTSTKVFSVSGFGDGANGKAEVYAVMRANYASSFKTTMLD